jgi:hypothetical protein
MRLIPCPIASSIACSVARPSLCLATLVAAAVMAFPLTGWCQQQTAEQPATTAQAAADTPAASAPKQESLAEAARRSREQKKESKPVKVFTNDNIPTKGGISTVGAVAAEPGASSDTGTPDAKGAKGSGDEKTWRDKFAALHHNLDQDTTDLDVMQRELGVLNVQYYSDPVKGMQQGLTRDDINKKTADIDAKKQAIQADQKAIDDAEEDLRKSGGDPGWSR